MKTTLQPIEHLGRFERLQWIEDMRNELSAESTPETRPQVLDELVHRANWRDSHPSVGKSLIQIAEMLGVHL
jgi:hypothetical protein